MVKKNSRRPGGRPREYSDKMRSLSLALPEFLVERLDEVD